MCSSRAMRRAILISIIQLTGAENTELEEYFFTLSILSRNLYGKCGARPWIDQDPGCIFGRMVSGSHRSTVSQFS